MTGFTVILRSEATKNPPDKGGASDRGILRFAQDDSKGALRMTATCQISLPIPGSSFQPVHSFWTVSTL